jgi:hypothetical protein
VRIHANAFGEKSFQLSRIGLYSAVYGRAHEGHRKGSGTLRRVRELDYQPNVLARSLVTGRSYLIGLVVPDLLHPFFAEVAKALSTVVGQRGYSVIISSSEEDPELEAREIRQMVARQLDALVIASCGDETAAFERTAIRPDRSTVSGVSRKLCRNR